MIILIITFVAIPIGLMYLLTTDFELMFKSPEDIYPITAPDTSTTVNTTEVEYLVNQYRIANGKKPLEHSELLCKYARQRAYEIQTVWGHERFGNVAIVAMNKERKGTTMWGENLAKGYDISQEMVDAWIASPTHKDNLDFDFNESCVSCVGLYCSQLFAQ